MAGELESLLEHVLNLKSVGFLGRREEGGGWEGGREEGRSGEVIAEFREGLKDGRRDKKKLSSVEARAKVEASCEQ